MKTRFKLYLLTFFLFVLLFVLQKPLFMLRYLGIYKECPLLDWLKVMWHGLPLDFSVAGYLTIIPGLLLIVSIWTRRRWVRRTAKIYFLIVSFLMSMVFVVDLILYKYWGFRLDATPLFYFFSSPKDAFASVSVWTVIGGFLAILLLTAVLYFIFWICLLRTNKLEKKLLPLNPLLFTILFLLLLALLILPIRGGVTVSTMNVGKVYFSENIRLNHAATNPIFSLLESLSKQKNFGQQYRFEKKEDADKLFSGMLDPQVKGSSVKAAAPGDSLAQKHIDVLNTDRPNVLFIILESFSNKLMATLGGEKDVAVNLDALSREGLLFRNFYATSFRTDRGLVSILSGYPAQPTTSIMKYPKKTQSLPSIVGHLRKAGYSAGYYYGGDADFTNMRSYLMSSGFQGIVCDKDFPVTDRLSKWGVHDHLVFNRLLGELKREKTKKPWFRVLQTSSSHEPYDVPYHRLVNERLNAFAYTDSCVGSFVHELKQLPQWKNTLVVLVPDHQGCYPEKVDNLTLERYQIPLIMIGGALKGPGNIDIYGSQTDIAATLLAQLGISHEEFTFSKDILNPQSPHFAFFTVPDAFGLVDGDNQVIFNNETKKVVLDQGKKKGKNLASGKAYLQKLYDDIDKR